MPSNALLMELNLIEISEKLPESSKNRLKLPKTCYNFVNMLEIL